MIQWIHEGMLWQRVVGGKELEAYKKLNAFYGRTKRVFYSLAKISFTQSWTKLLKQLANFHLFSQQSSVLQPPPPISMLLIL